jgi:DNA-3-methyladenine glycosylase II
VDALGAPPRPTALTLSPTPPFRLDLTAWALRRRPVNAIDRFDGTTYRRILVVADRAMVVAVRQTGSPDRPKLHVTSPEPLTREERAAVRAQLEKALGLHVELRDFHAMAARDRLLAPLAATFRGLKPPRFPTVFEALVNGFACQQLSLTVGLTLLDRLARRHGLSATDDTGEIGHAFPTPEALAEAKPSALLRLGFSGQKARAIVTLGRDVARGRVDLERLEGLDSAEARRALRALYGVGPWTADYVLLRGLGRIEVFPADDVGARNNLARLLGRNEPLDAEGVRRVTRRWGAFAGLVYFHMLLDRVQSAGWLGATEA